MIPLQGVLALVIVLATALPLFLDHAPPARGLRALAALVAIVGMFAPSGALAFGALAVGLVLNSATCGSRSGAVGLLLAAAATLGAGLALALDLGPWAWGASLAALALRTGVWPLNLGTASIAERRPAALIDLSATLPAAVFVHLHHAIPAATELAHAGATVAVVVGAAAAVLGGLASVSASDLRTLWSTSYSMHGAMLVAALGAAGRGHVAAAIFVSVSFALALGGFGAMVVATESRTGRVSLHLGGGRSTAFPRITWTFAFFAAAGIALPGTLGFAADDLLLHALWEESPLASTLMLVASALLAVGLLRGFSAVYLGAAPKVWTAEDLSMPERWLSGAVIVLLVTSGIYPMWLLEPVLQVFPIGAPGH